ncbi:zinc finger CCCH domain-containing protein 2-like [Arachis stenosperma]|uniref:zinc finger CCCH domain-containing protein 2-like n=1 Tax=Arachis stenosperma TaxID=217475 RepID=UPI0025ABC773|nr:zinc finger CCCH domain-containing protein 2-like [Arachis stenosperma]
MSICSDQQHHHKFYPSQQLLSPKKSLRDIDVPPRKLLTRRAAAVDAGEIFSDDTLFQKFLPCNNPADDSGSDGDDPYSSDHFRMYEFKVRRCTRSRSHDWTDCPFAHPGEKARRRDPRRYHYSGTVCPEYRRGACSRGDGCEFAHGVFECWLHPARYRTEACKDGKNCKRKVCFFAHTPKQLRILPVTMSTSNDISPCKKNKLFLNPSSGSSSNNSCCLFCHHCAGGGGGGGGAAVNSPTSTLLGMSRFSPPLSPSSSATSPPVSPISRLSRYGACRGGGGGGASNLSYKDVVNELMSSLEGLSFSDALNYSDVSGVSAAKVATNMPWVDVPLSCEDQQEFIFSPSSPMMMTPTRNCDDDGKFSRFFIGNENRVVAHKSNSDANISNDINGANNCPAPDLGWVNDLLM